MASLLDWMRFRSFWLVRRGYPMFKRLPRMLSAGKRVFPDYIIIGAQKGGTTSLENYLRQHPQVVPPVKKEIHFFDTLNSSVRWYKSHFPTKARMERVAKRVGKRVITGEATPHCLSHPRSAGRIHELLPQVKLIVLLRDPVTRAYSHYHMTKRKGLERLSFEEAVARERERLDGEREKLAASRSYKSFDYRHYSYLERGIYDRQLEEYYRYFPREQILICSSEQLFRDPQAVYDEVLAFLGLDPFQIPRPEARNAGGYDKKAMPLEQELRAYFKPHNERLYALLGRDFGWKGPAAAEAAPAATSAAGG